MRDSSVARSQKSNLSEMEMVYLKTLSKQYPTIASASREIINLQAILSLPKGTEHFLTDIHGEYEQFNHVLKNGSGAIRSKIDEVFSNNMTEKDKKSLATLIYYPRERLEIAMDEEENIDDWFKVNLHRLVQMTRRVASKYTRSKVRKALPGDFAYVIEELITEKEEISNKEMYYNEIINTIIKTGSAPDFIISMGNLIQRLTIDHLHIVGDIFDRGPLPHMVMDRLMNQHSVDIQWGNHDITWMAAASGSMACIATVLRIAARYANLDIIEEGYGINLIPLVTFAMETYSNTDCEVFSIKYNTDYNTKDLSLDMMIHKAISIMQFKLEGQIIKRHPEFKMDDRLLLDKINYEAKTINIGGTDYPIKDTDFPTVDPARPYELSPGEQEVMLRLQKTFMSSEKLQRHVRFLFTNGGMYKVFNKNLLYHGCVPLDDDGEFMKINVAGKEYSGKDLYDVLEQHARKGFYSNDPLERQYGQDIMWYIWTGPGSPVFGKDRMATFERYFLEEKETHKENKNSYYRFYDNEEVINRILVEFGLPTEGSHIVNGHVPVELKKGQTPVKCKGKLLIIDGGFSRAYSSKTGIAGYTLVYSSHGMRLMAHETYESREHAVRMETDIVTGATIIETALDRVRVSDTDIGNDIRDTIVHLENLLYAYQSGELSEGGGFLGATSEW